MATRPPSTRRRGRALAASNPIQGTPQCQTPPCGQAPDLCLKLPVAEPSWGRFSQPAERPRCQLLRAPCTCHPDAELFALIERARTADSLADEACEAADDVLFKIAPSFPQALIWTESDTPHWYGLRAGERVSNRDIDFLRHWLKCARKPDPIAAGVVPLIPLLAFAERAREIVQTKDEFEASWQAAGEHPDVLEAQARHEALSERWSELAMRVATTPAKTMEGLIAKIALIASGYAEDDLDGTYDGRRQEDTARGPLGPTAGPALACAAAASDRAPAALARENAKAVMGA